MCPQILREDPPEVLFRAPRWRTVVIGYVEVVNTVIECEANNVTLCLERAVVTEVVPQSQCNARELQT